MVKSTNNVARLYWFSIGLASATSQLDRNAWQRVATYKSGSKQTWRRIFFVCNHIEKAQTRIEHQSSFHFVEQLQLCFSCLPSSGSDSVLYSKFLCHVSGSSSRISLSLVSPALLLKLKKTLSRPTISFPWAVLCVVDFVSLILVGHSTGKTHGTMKRRQVHIMLRRRMTSMQPCSWTNIRACRSTSARSETAPYSTQILPNPHYLFKYESVSCRKVAKPL